MERLFEKETFYFWAWIFKCRKRHTWLQENSEPCFKIWKCGAGIERVQELVDCNSTSNLTANPASSQSFASIHTHSLSPSLQCPSFTFIWRLVVFIRLGRLNCSNTNLKSLWLHPTKIHFLLRLQGHLGRPATHNLYHLHSVTFPSGPSALSIYKQRKIVEGTGLVVIHMTSTHVLWLWQPHSLQRCPGTGKCSVPVHKGGTWMWTHNIVSATLSTHLKNSHWWHPQCMWHRSRALPNISSLISHGLLWIILNYNQEIIDIWYNGQKGNAESDFCLL